MFLATLFDYNGVLVDDEAVHLAAFRDVLEPLGVEVDEAAYWNRYIGYDDAGAFEAMLSDAGRQAPSPQIAELVELKRPRYLERARRGLSAFEGAAALVRRRATRGPVGIVSGALRDEIGLGLDLLGVSDCISKVIAAEDTSRSKPDPEGYVLGARWVASCVAGAAPRSIVVVEDSVAGIEAAKAAGLFCVAVAHSYPAARLRATAADAVVDAIADVTDALLESLEDAPRAH